MLRGNSRGEAAVPRDDSFERPWEKLTDALKINWRGYPDDHCIAKNDGRTINTPVFIIRPYDWDAECDCGANDAMEAWHAANKHADHCYQSEKKRRTLQAGITKTFGNEQYEKIRHDLCVERGLDPVNGSEVHCDCGYYENARIEWVRIGGHKPECRLIQPNFLYKPTGFKIHWYKYPFRDSYMTPQIGAEEWAKIIDHCIASAQQASS